MIRHHSLDRARRVAGTLVVAAFVGGGVAACSGGSDTPVTPAGPAPVARVTVGGVGGAADSLTVGDRRALTASLAAANGASLAGRTIAWTSSDATIAAVDGTGGVSALAPGQATISAESEGVRGQTVVSIRRRPVASVRPERMADTLWLGRPKVLRAQAYAADGTTLVDRAVTWSVADSTLVTLVAALDGSVTARGVALGTTPITVRSEGSTATIPLVVVPVPVARVALTTPDTVVVGRTATVRLTAFAPDNTPLTVGELAGRAAAWASDRPAIVSLSAVDATTATARGASPGNATLSATLAGVTGSYTVIAARPAVARVLFAPTTLALSTGASATATATAVDDDGQPVDAEILFAITTGGTIVRTTSSVAVGGRATVRIDGAAPGAAVVFAAANGKGATLPVIVTDPAGAALRAFPTTITATPGTRARLALSLTDAAGMAQTPTGVVYRSSSPTVATVDADGRVQLVAPGSATVTVTANGRTATVPITVAVPPATTFTIRLVPVGAVPPAVMTAAQEAANRWLRVITSELTVAQIDLDPSQCDFGTTSLHTVSTGVVVYVRAANIDGARNTLAYAGPCVVRASSSGLPLVGALVVDSADVGLLSGTGAALGVDVLTHELGHVLGIGTIWEGGTAGGRLAQTIGDDVRFMGRSGAEAAYRMGLTADPAYGAPIEDEGGAGTAGGHWRERVFRGELMTGWINPSPNPLSILSVLSLRDLGYQVTELGADVTSPLTIGGGTLYPLGPASVAANRIPFGTVVEPFQIGERLIRPRYEADARGTRPIAP